MSDSIAEMAATFADRLRRAHDERFVGRERELASFDRLLAREGEPRVLFVHGPGGIGKSTLLERLARKAEDAGLRPLRIDARDVDASVAGFLAALGNEDPAAFANTALFIDTAETIAILEPWLRTTFVPNLPLSALVVLAGRRAPSTAWRLDPAWQGILTTIELQHLDGRESRELLARRGVDGDTADAIVGRTQGLPLALALAADVSARTLVDELDADVVRVLLDAFVRELPTARHREALSVCALARITDEALLHEVLGDGASSLYDWLRELSFVTHAKTGVFPHDLARDVLTRDLLQRDAHRARDLRRRLRTAIFERFRALDDLEQKRSTLYDMLFVGRHAPALRSFYTWREADAGYAEPARPSDHDAIAALVEQYQGRAAASLARHWLGISPQSFTVFRGADHEVRGVLCCLLLDGDDGSDPAIAAAFRHVERIAPLTDGDRVLHVRFWIVRDAYQLVSPVQDQIQTRITIAWLTSPNLAWSFVPTTRPDIWGAQFTALDMPPSDDAAFELEGYHYTVYTHDWRRTPPSEWLMRNEPRRPSEAALSRDALDTAVKNALRDFARTHVLETSPLLASAVVTAAGPASAETLRNVLRAAAFVLDEHPRDRKLLRALDVTFFKAAISQEAAAERLGVPFGTYRRHLAKGIERVSEIVWERELAARAGRPVAIVDD